MISEHDEIEAKLAADNVSIADFQKYMAEFAGLEKYVRITSPDRYYECGPNVVRVRGRDGANDRPELTVKRRKSEGSTRDRLEVDLHFDDKTKIKDIVAFLGATGYTHSFTIEKESHIYWVKLSDNLMATFVIYDVWLQDEGKRARFIEVEAEKGSNVTAETGKRHVREQVKALQARFGVGEPLNESLYEIYSGKRYQVV